MGFKISSQSAVNYIFVLETHSKHYRYKGLLQSPAKESLYGKLMGVSKPHLSMELCFMSSPLA